MKHQTNPPHTDGAQTTVAPVAPGRCDGIMPEFVRPTGAVRLFGIGKSTLAVEIKRGRIASYLVRQPGNKSGMRLISTASLRAFIEGHADGDSSKATE
jgi:hypothetical protein